MPYDLPNTKEERPVYAFSDLFRDKIIWLVVIALVEGERSRGRSPPVESHLAQEAQALSHEPTALIPSHGVSHSEANKIADGGIVHSCSVFEHRSRVAHVQSNLYATIDQHYGSREFLVAVRSLEMEACRPGKGRHQGGNHACQQGEKIGICAVLASLERRAECGLVRKWHKGEYVRVEVVDKEFEDAERRDALLGVQDRRRAWCAQGDQGLGGILMGGSRVAQTVDLDLLAFLSLLRSLGGSIRRAPPLLDTVVCAWNTEVSAWGARGRSALALYRAG